MSRNTTSYRGSLTRGLYAQTNDSRFRSVMRQLEDEVQRGYNLGPIITPDISIRDAISSLPHNGGRIVLSEGEWTFNTNLSVTRPNVHILSMSPQKTILRRTKTTSDNMLTLSGAECIIEGIRFIDENSSGFCIESTGDRTVVKNCFFQDVYGGIKMDGADFCTVEGNHFVDADGHNVEFANTCVGALISNNRFEEASGSSKFNILLSTGTTKSTMVGNVLDWAGGEISSPYRATGMQLLATIPLANVVDTSNITETV